MTSGTISGGSMLGDSRCNSTTSVDVFHLLIFHWIFLLKQVWHYISSFTIKEKQNKNECRLLIDH